MLLLNCWDMPVQPLGAMLFPSTLLTGWVEERLGLEAVSDIFTEVTLKIHTLVPMSFRGRMARDKLLD